MFKKVMVLLCLLPLGACRSQTLPGDAVCPDIYMPVCGADGRNYPNACEAQKAGQSYQSGECNDLSIQPILGS
ncbi:MAG: kazal domain protein [Candidatus Sericytochromatia bacterium]|nr:kazal domain protein [Candidatus Sericytochromatia bacterium]